jgi:uncharacterized protein (DUF2384 family)
MSGYVEMRLLKQHVEDVIHVCLLARAGGVRGLLRRRAGESGGLSESESDCVERVEGHFKSAQDVFKYREEAERLETALKNAR